jgi:cell division protein FtsB
MKRYIYKIVLCVQVCLFVYVFMYGNKGWFALSVLKKEVDTIAESVVCKKAEISILEQEMSEWAHDAFYKEKVAREQLQMARAGDEVFYVN